MSISQTLATSDDAYSGESGPLAVLYRLLSQSMRSPVQGHLDETFFQVFFALLDQTGLADEAAALREADLLNPEGMEALQVEYTRLFVNGLPQVAAPPYGSVYLDGGAMLQGPSTGCVLRCYRDHGFEPAHPGEPADSIWLELEFMARLLDAGDVEAEQAFRRDFLRPWLPALAARILHEARHPFYRLTIQLIDILTKEDE